MPDSLPNECSIANGSAYMEKDGRRSQPNDPFNSQSLPARLTNSDVSFGVDRKPPEESCTMNLPAKDHSKSAQKAMLSGETGDHVKNGRKLYGSLSSNSGGTTPGSDNETKIAAQILEENTNELKLGKFSGTPLEHVIKHLLNKLNEEETNNRFAPSVKEAARDEVDHTRYRNKVQYNSALLHNVTERNLKNLHHLHNNNYSQMANNRSTVVPKSIDCYTQAKDIDLAYRDNFEISNDEHAKNRGEYIATGHSDNRQKVSGEGENGSEVIQKNEVEEEEDNKRKFGDDNGVEDSEGKEEGRKENIVLVSWEDKEDGRKGDTLEDREENQGECIAEHSEDGRELDRVEDKEVKKEGRKYNIVLVNQENRKEGREGDTLKDREENQGECIAEHSEEGRELDRVEDKEVKKEDRKGDTLEDREESQEEYREKGRGEYRSKTREERRERGGKENSKEGRSEKKSENSIEVGTEGSSRERRKERGKYRDNRVEDREKPRKQGTKDGNEESRTKYIETKEERSIRDRGGGRQGDRVEDKKKSREESSGDGKNKNQAKVRKRGRVEETEEKRVEYREDKREDRENRVEDGGRNKDKCKQEASEKDRQYCKGKDRDDCKVGYIVKHGEEPREEHVEQCKKVHVEITGNENDDYPPTAEGIQQDLVEGCSKVHVVSTDNGESKVEESDALDFIAVTVTELILPLSVQEEDLTTINHDVNETELESIEVANKKGEKSEDEAALAVARDGVDGKPLCHAKRLTPEAVATVCYPTHFFLKADYDDVPKRLRSFLGYDGVMSSTDLAHGGFISCKNGDEVLCVFCCLQLKDFVVRVDAIAIHLTYSYQVECEFLAKRGHEMMKMSTALSHFSLLATGAVARRSEPGNVVAVAHRIPHLTSTAQHDQSDETSEISTLESLNDNERYLHFLTRRRNSSQNKVQSIGFKPKHNLLYEDESCRQETFVMNGLLDPTVALQLASDGFYQREREILCAFCDYRSHVSSELQSSSEIIATHHIYGRCLTRERNIPQVLDEYCYEGFAESRPSDVSNTSQLQLLGVNTQRAAHPEFAVADRRWHSFLTYPYNAPKSPDALMEAGYFYAGGEDGSVVCFSCGIVSSGWRSSEDVWDRHARSSKQCQFVLSQKGPDFIAQAIERSGEHRTPRPENRINTVTMRMLRPRWDTEVAQKAIANGSDRALVKTAIINRIKKGEKDFVHLAEIVREVADLAVPQNALVPAVKPPELPVVTSSPLPSEEQEEGEIQLALPAPSAESNELEIDGVETDNQGEDILTTDGAIASDALSLVDATTFDDMEPTPENFKKIQSQLTCKICFSNIVGIIFLPCGHLVCCTGCAAAMLICPLCRKEVTATVKANFPG